MLLKLCFAELHTPLFLAGRNFGLKLDTVKLPLNLAYDRAEKELLVEYNGIVALIPSSNVVSMTPVDVKFQMPEKTPKAKIDVTIMPFKPIKAQVEVPKGLKLE